MQSKIEILQREADANVDKISELTKKNVEINILLQNMTKKDLQLKNDMQTKIETLKQEADANAEKVSELTKKNQEMNTLLKSKTEECLHLKNVNTKDVSNPIERLL